MCASFPKIVLAQGKRLRFNYGRMSTTQISEKLTRADIKHVIKGDKVVVTHIFGDRKNYGYLVEGDDGSTGTCQNINIRAGTIKAALRD